MLSTTHSFPGRLMCAAFAAMAAFVAASAEEPVVDPELLETEHELSMAFETPHTDWAQPYAGGTARVLFFAPWYQGSTEAREIIELMQRFDLDADAVYYLKGSRLLGDGNPRWYGDPEAGTKRVLRLLEQPYDAVFMNQVAMDALPEAVQDKLRGKIQGGTGLVIVGQDEVASLGKPKELPPGESIGGPATAYRVGKGRVIVLPLRDTLEFAVGWETELDYQMALQGRAILSAAQRTPRLELRVRAPEGDVARSELPGRKIEVTWTGGSSGAEIRAEVRRWDGDRRLLGVAQASGEGLAGFGLPRLRAGEYHADIFAVGSEGVENWATEPFVVTASRRVSAVTLDKDWAEVGETFAGEVQLEGSLEPGDTVRAQLVDPRGRVLTRKDLAGAENACAPFTFTVEPWMPMLLRVEALIMNETEEVASAYAFLRVTKRHQNQFNFVVWNYPSGDLAPYGIESMARHGATAILQGGDPEPALSASELSFVPYATSFRKSSHTVTAMLDPEGIMKGGCVHDDEVMDEWVRSVVERYAAARGHGVLVYSLGDENAVRGSCLSPHCLEAYQRYLEEVYGDVAALNAEWGSAYASFDQIAFLEDGELPAEDAPRWFKEFFAQRLQKSRTDNEGDGEEQIVLGDKNDELRALQAENYARWYDRQAFQCHTYVYWCKRFRDAFREVDPKSLTGFEGTDSFTMRRLTTRSRQGGDLDAFVRELEYFGPYGGPANEVVRSIAPPTFPMGNWIGYSMEADVLLEKYWGQITNCMNTVQWWRWDCLDGYHGFLSPNLMPFPATRELVEDTQIVRDGLGTLLMNCEMVDDDVAMLYSMPSTHIAHFDGNRTYGNYKRDHKLWHEAIHEAGLQFRYVTDRMLRLGEFDAKRFKVLILPLAFALGPEEADVIREYVRKGGTLVADVRPGTCTGHCKPLQKGVLDDVFGIERSGKQDSVGLDRMYVDGEINGVPVAMRWGNWYGKEIYPQMRVDPTVTLTTGRELGKAFPIHFWHGLNHPVCVVNEFGKGRAVLLNFAIYHAPAQPLIEGILASAGIACDVRLTGRDGAGVTGVEITRWRNGDIGLMAFLGKHEGDVTVTLPEPRVVHELKSGRSFGTVTEFTTSLRPNRAAFFALFPEPAAKPELRLDAKRAARGEVLTASVSIPEAQGNHAVRISVVTPVGDKAGWLDQVVIVGRQRAQIALPVACNDPPGEWTIRAVDVLTGQESSAGFTVGQRQVASQN